jgi:hypothetical protein
VCVDKRGSAEDHSGETDKEAHGFAANQRAAGTKISKLSTKISHLETDKEAQ